MDPAVGARTPPPHIVKGHNVVPNVDLGAARLGISPLHPKPTLEGVERCRR